MFYNLKTEILTFRPPQSQHSTNRFLMCECIVSLTSTAIKFSVKINYSINKNFPKTLTSLGN